MAHYATIPYEGRYCKIHRFNVRGFMSAKNRRNLKRCFMKDLAGIKYDAPPHYFHLIDRKTPNRTKG